METITSDMQQAAPNILVVDDTPAFLQLLTGMLKKRGYRVRPVPGGKLAIQMAQSERPDLILLDVNMPEMDGYEVCERLKADEALRQIPVVFISGMNETTGKVRAFAAGGVDYVTKPFQFEEVAARVQTHLKLRQLQVELEGQNDRLQDSYDQLKRLEDLQENLTHMIVHDMRSPLMGITGYLQILEEDAGAKLTLEELAMLRDARSGGQALVGMVTSLLDVGRLEQGRMPLNVTAVDMDGLIQDALKSLGSLTRRVRLLYEQQAEPVMVDCDASLVTRVIANLVANAIKFNPEGSKVTVSVEKNGAGVTLSVSDTGNGIPREYQQKIFEKFGQVEARQQRQVCSTGLGLTFCKLAVEAHGGTIGVDSDVGKGSRFWFTLHRRPTERQGC
jgi:signal transduction histidine kinase